MISIYIIQTKTTHITHTAKHTRTHIITQTQNKSRKHTQTQNKGHKPRHDILTTKTQQRQQQ